MPSLVYAPGIKVYIDTYKQGILDVSEDITDFNMSRRSDGVSTFQFNLQNTRRKYDNVFTPNDRIVVMMKRLKWMRTFTGYLNGVPLFTAWPRVVPLTASCSLKRLQYFYWDSTIPASETLVRNALQATTAFGQPDGGIKNVVLELLDKVVGWNGPKGSQAEGGGKVHIGNIPDNWYQFAVEIAKGVQDGVLEAQNLAAEMKNQLGGGATMYGENTNTTSLVPPGKYGRNDYSAAQVANATKIILVGRQMGATERDLVAAIATAITECGLLNLASRAVPGSEKVPGIDGIAKGDHDSVGLFQQRDNGAWTEGKDPIGAQRLNPEHAATAFFKVLLALGNRDKTPVHMLAQLVQRSYRADGSNYKQYVDDAAAIVQASTIPTQGTSVVGFRPGSDTLTKDTTLAGSAASGRGIVEVAIGVTQRLSIPYRLGGDSSYDDDNPKVLDCSSFVQWAYFHATGSIGGLPRTASAQAQWALANGGKQVSVETGIHTSGALMFMGSSIAGIHHVEISVGNGRQTIGAHHSGTTAGVVNAGAKAWDYAVLLPGIDYTGSAIDGGTPVATYDPNSNDPRVNGDMPPRGSQNRFVSTGAGQGGDTASKDPIDALFGTTNWVSQAGTGAGQELTGIIALANDEPILPYITNLLNATLRAFCSAPNGDFIAWFPDYYGLWGTAAIMQLEPIEVVDFAVNWSDDYFVTHQFVTGSNPGVGLSEDEGTLVNQNGFLPIQQTHGIASIDEPAIMKALFGYDRTDEATKEFTYFIYQRFGARPNWTEQAGIIGPKAEFFYALFLFMRQWAFQYDANIDVTFMPELWPGMLVQMPFFNFQAYVTTVTHSGSFAPGGGFSTQINIASPARLSDKDSRLQGLPLAGKYDAGRTTTDPYADRATVAHENAISGKQDRMTS